MEFDICVSDRCFFPKSAFMSSKAVVRLAKSLGYEQVEFHPTWAVFWEVLTRGKLSCQAGDISSFHIGWREDGVGAGFGFLKRMLMPTYFIFPFESLGTLALQRLEKVYKKQTVCHWPWDFEKFKNPILELHSFLHFGLREIKDLVKDGKIKGLVVDTDKFDGWLKRHKHGENWALKKLLPDICEVHFRFGYKENIGASLNIGKTNSARILAKLIKLGFEGRVVVEMGWPDKRSVFVLKKYGLEKVHKEIVGFLRSLS